MTTVASAEAAATTKATAASDLTNGLWQWFFNFLVFLSLSAASSTVNSIVSDLVKRGKLSQKGQGRRGRS